MPYFDSPDGEWVMRQFQSVCNQISEQAATTLVDFDEEGMMRLGSEVRRATIEVLVSGGTAGLMAFLVGVGKDISDTVHRSAIYLSGVGRSWTGLW